MLKKLLLAALAGIVFLFLIGLVLGPPPETTTADQSAPSGPPEPSTTVQVTEASPMAHKIAAVDAGQRTVQRAAIAEVEGLLTSLDGFCVEDANTIGDMATKASQMRTTDGTPTTVVAFLRLMNNSFPEGAETLGLKCAEVAAMILTAG